MINIDPKAKLIAKPKQTGKSASKVPRRPVGYFDDALTSEDVAEINLFSRLIAQNNAKSL